MKTIALKLNTPFSTLANLVAEAAGFSEDNRPALSAFTMTVTLNGQDYSITPAAVTTPAEVKMTESQTKLRDAVLTFVRMSPTETVRMSALVNVASLDSAAVTTMIACSDSGLRFYSTGKGAQDDKVIGRAIPKVAKTVAAPSPEAPSGKGKGKRAA